MDGLRSGNYPMADPINEGPPEPPPAPLEPPAAPVAPTEADDRFGRYDANVQLILRRLADSDRNRKPRWWWQGR